MFPMEWAEIGPWGLVTIFVLFVGTGLLIPRWTFSKILRDKDTIIELQQKALDKRDEQFNTLAEQNKLTIVLLQDIKRMGQVRQGQESSPL
jgi:hypothetical protein